jgi:hypothetical protein
MVHKVEIPYWAKATDIGRWKIGDDVQVCVNIQNREWVVDWQEIKMVVVGIKWNHKEQRVEITCHDGYAETDSFSVDDLMSWI